MPASTVIGPVPFTSVSWQPGGSHIGNAEAARRVGGPGHGETPGRANEGETAQQPNSEILSQEELRQLEQLKATDREVRQHETAHQVAGGQYTGAASYQFEHGPDGQRYAVAGEVTIDYGPVPGDPSATIGKMQQVISAALASASPSPKDRQIASQARQYLLTAHLELAQQASARHSAGRAAPHTAAASDSKSANSSATLETGKRSLTNYDIIARAAIASGNSTGKLSGKA